MAAAVAGWRVRDYNTYVPQLTSTNLVVYTCKSPATNTLEGAFCERSHVHVVGTVGRFPVVAVLALVAVVITSLSSEAAFGRGWIPCWWKGRSLFNLYPARTSLQGAHLLQNRVEPLTPRWGRGTTAIRSDEARVSLSGNRSVVTRFERSRSGLPVSSRDFSKQVIIQFVS